ncbi:MAG: Glu/Leu/Phe/Val dehydrogenase [Candidatus Altiarchaeota archaeon]
MVTMENPFENAKQVILTAAEKMELEPWITEILLVPRREIKVSFPVEMDDGSIKVFEGYRVQHNNALGPHKGGLRYHWNINIDEIRALSTWMSIKCATLNLPMGGSKGGIICHPRANGDNQALSEKELEKITRAFIRAIASDIGPDKDIPAPDVYTNSQIMGWVVDEYAKASGKPKTEVLGVVTGKSLDEGGSLGRKEATGRGGQLVLRQSIEKGHAPIKSLEGTTVAIQGYGNAGSIFAMLAHEQDRCKVIAVSDSKGAIYTPSGLEPRKVLEYKNQNKTVVGYPGATQITNSELLELECDILVPAALENVITYENAGKIKAKVIVELANGPTTPIADATLHEKGVLVLPDILANAGGVTVSCYEWQQNLANEKWSAQDIDSKLEKAMMTNTELVMQTAKKHSTTPRIGAYILAIGRISEKIRKQKIDS